MKLLPTIQLPQLTPVSAAGGITGMEPRLPSTISLPFSHTDLLWRYGPAMNFPPTTHPPPSPLLDFKTHLPTSLGERYYRIIYISHFYKRRVPYLLTILNYLVITKREVMEYFKYYT